VDIEKEKLFVCCFSV
jgi:hypothetical protein